MPAGLCFGASNSGYNGIPEFTPFGELSVRLSEGSLVLMAAFSVRSNCVLYLVVVSIVVPSYLVSSGP